jgi:hypothetical protein
MGFDAVEGEKEIVELFCVEGIQGIVDIIQENVPVQDAPI